MVVLGGLVAQLVLGAGVFRSPALGASANAPPEESASSDGMPYPDAIEKRVTIDMPVLGPILGEKPGAALRGKRVLHTDKSKEPIERAKVSIWTDPRTFGIKQPETPWHCFRLAGADTAEIFLTDGRITAVRLHFGRMTDQRAKAIANAMTAQSVNGAPDSPLWEGHVRVRVKLMRDAVFKSVRGYAFPAERVQDGAAILLFEIEPTEWYLLCNEVEPRIAEAMRGAKLVVGMTEEEAQLTLVKTCVVKVAATTGETKVLEWYEPVDAGRGRRLKWAAVIENGRIVTIAQ